MRFHTVLAYMINDDTISQATGVLLLCHTAVWDTFHVTDHELCSKQTWKRPRKPLDSSS